MGADRNRMMDRLKPVTGERLQSGGLILILGWASGKQFVRHPPCALICLSRYGKQAAKMRSSGSKSQQVGRVVQPDLVGHQGIKIDSQAHH